MNTPDDLRAYAVAWLAERRCTESALAARNEHGCQPSLQANAEWRRLRGDMEEAHRKLGVPDYVDAQELVFAVFVAG